MDDVRKALAAVERIALASQGGQELAGLLGCVCREVAETFEFERVSLWRYEPATDEGVLVAVHGAPSGLVDLAAPPRAHRPYDCSKLSTGDVVFVPDAKLEPGIASIAETFGITAAVLVPLRAAGSQLGFIAADRAGRPFVLSEVTRVVLVTIGIVTASLFEQAIVHEDMRRLDASKSDFIAVASHELRTPVAVVAGAAATLQKRAGSLTAEQESQLQDMLLDNAQRLGRLVDQLLDLSRLDAGAVPIAPQRLPIRHRVEELVRAVAGERATEVDVRVPPELEVLVDPTAFERIVSNLLSNALRYGAPPVHVDAVRSDGQLSVFVEDRGDGIAPDFVPRLFERFTRNSSDGVQGAGIGLAVAQSYARAHGGELLYEPADPRGARFRLELPA
jgi:two-component system sensor histidine kinase KdpD